MSKYALKLEQLVQTDSYGDILVTIQYDGKGPKLVTANGDNLDSELKHLLDTILGLVNFSLAKGIEPNDIAEQLEVEPQDGVHLPINDVLLVIASSLKEAPNGIQEINPGILLEVAPEMIKEFTQNAAVSSIADENLASEGAKQEEVSEPKEEQQQNNQPNYSQNSQNEDQKDSSEEEKGFFGGFGHRKQ